MKYDDILQEIGEFGPYQKRAFFLLCLPIAIAGPQLLSVLFTYDIPAYRCALPDYPNDTYKIQNEVHARLVNQSIPPAGDDDEGVYSGCYMYSHTNTSVMTTSNVRNTSETQECERWVHDKTDYENTIITEFNLVCGDEIMRSHANMLHFVGQLTGSLFMGIFADIFGRKKAIMLSLIIVIGYGVITLLATTFYVILAARVLGGIASHSLFVIPAITGIELVGPNKRSFTGLFVQYYWCGGILLLLPAAYALRQWQYTQLVITLTALTLLSLWWLIPESPRWLIEKKRYAEAEVILKKICKSNKCNLPEGAVGSDSIDGGPQVKFRDMLSHKVLIIRCLIISFNWFAVNLLYYGLSLSATNLEGSPYLNYFFSNIVELAAYLLCMPFVDRVGRKKFHCVTMYVGGVACLAVIPCILLDAGDGVITALAFVGKFSASCCYAILYILSSEQFPTVVRSSALGFCSVFESLGGMCSPYIADLGIAVGGPMSKGIPMIVFGGLSLLAGGLSIFLPETLHKILPETLQDAVDFGRKQPSQSKTKNGYELAPVPAPDTDTPMA